VMWPLLIKLLIFWGPVHGKLGFDQKFTSWSLLRVLHGRHRIICTVYDQQQECLLSHFLNWLFLTKYCMCVKNFVVSLWVWAARALALAPGANGDSGLSLRGDLGELLRPIHQGNLRPLHETWYSCSLCQANF